MAGAVGLIFGCVAFALGMVPWWVVLLIVLAMVAFGSVL